MNALRRTYVIGMIIVAVEVGYIYGAVQWGLW